MWHQPRSFLALALPMCKYTLLLLFMNIKEVIILYGIHFRRISIRHANEYESLCGAARFWEIFFATEVLNVILELIMENFGF